MAFERIELNICPAGDMPVFHCSQYDVGRPIIIDLLNGDDAFTPTAGTTFELHCRKVDDNIVTLDTYEVDGNTLTFTSTEQLCACPGDNLCEVAIYLDELCMGTLNFMLHVEPDPLAGGLESESQIHDLYEQVEEITEQVIGDDYYNKTEVDDLLDDKADKATTYTKTEVDTALNLKADKSTTYTKTETNNLLAGKADANDTYSKAQVDSKLSLKADKATTYTKTETDTLLGYKANTSDVYTRSQTDSLLNNKADKSTTYTKTEVNNALALKANTADLATVATTGDYDDLINKPTIPDAQVQSDYAQTDNTKVDYIKNKPDLSIYVTEEELILTTGTENQTPYLLRDTPNGVCNKCLDMIVGGTVAFNQLVDGSFSDNSIWGVNNGSLSVSDGVGTITPNTGNVSLSMYLKSAHRPDSISGHKYLITFNAKVNNTLSKNFVWSCNDQTYNNVTLTDGVKKNVTTVISSSFTLFKPYFYPWGTAPNTFDGTERAYIDGFMIIDLTQMFGSTIADYIYTLESGTAGAGVAWLKSHGYLTKPYYDYNAGSLESVKTTAHKTVGFNQWDEEWELGRYDTTTGEKVTDPYYIRSKNYIPIIGGITIYIKAPYNIRPLFYDANKDFVSAPTSFHDNTLALPSGACYMNFYVSPSYGTTYNHDICINIHSDLDGQYQPYVSHEYPLDDIDLRGILKLDGSNNLYYDGDTYESTGKVTRRYGIVDIGTITPTKYDVSGNNLFRFDLGTIKKIALSTAVPNIVCAKYPTVSNANRANKTLSQVNNSETFDIIDNDYSDAPTFQTAMDGVYLVYELATPATETADTFTNPQIVDGNGTEEYIDGRSIEIPVGHDTIYSKKTSYRYW